ncbi:helix-turn-helix domain-containing protein [Streptomyces glomeratus]|uniref:helix-turn-helix domain-containing protein n=1 Tax=Streptomyces glomeratus TaxID=284452 RepID=UPI001F3E7C2F|nr:LysR family transcriptional regulator [Streptomyces glomeratus]MCF1512042.1 LysR family transcriptional regulator [Streptomyces glomeratus]
METLHLCCFVAGAERPNSPAAARRLPMATSPLSRRFRDLEHELGNPLFDRDAHHVAKSDARLSPGQCDDAALHRFPPSSGHRPDVAPRPRRGLQPHRHPTRVLRHARLTSGGRPPSRS